MTFTKTALAAAILSVMAVSAHAQQGPTRQIQVLPAPVKQAQAPAVVAEPAPAKVDGDVQNADAPAAEAAPAVEAAPPVVAPKVVAPKLAPKVLVAAPEVRPEPKFIPVRKVSYGHGYGKRHCH